MLDLNKIGNSSIQITGSLQGIIVNGVAKLIRVNGGPVWNLHYKLIGERRQIDIKMNEKDGTVRNEDAIIERIDRSITEEKEKGLY